MRHTITTTVVNTPTGTPGSTDGVMMLVCTGAASTAGTTPLVVETPYLGSTLADFTDGLGITQDYDIINGSAAFKQINEYYDGGNNDGAKLWVVITTNATFASYVASDTFKNIIRATNASDPADRVKMIGICYAKPTATQSAADFPSDVISTITALQATQETLFQEGYMFSCIVDGKSLSSTATTSSIRTVASLLSPSVSLCITGSQPDGVSAVGAALGRFSRITVGHGFGAVIDGPSPLAEGYLTDGAYVLVSATDITSATALVSGDDYMVKVGPLTYDGVSYSFGEIFTAISTAAHGVSGKTAVKVTTTFVIDASSSYYVLAGPVTFNSVEYQTGETFTNTSASPSTAYGGIVIKNVATDVKTLLPSDYNNLGDKQYMFLRKWYDRPGIYWNDAATCDLATKPLSTQEFNRVANRLSADALNFCTDLLGSAIPITPAGTASPTFTSIKNSDFFNTYLNPLILSGDISNGEFSLTGTRNGLSTINWTYLLTINGNPITGSVTGEVKFV